MYVKQSQIFTYPGDDILGAEHLLVPVILSPSKRKVSLNVLRAWVGLRETQQESRLFIVYPLVNVYITMERSTIFDGKIHYVYGHFQ
jgi:hypothetical protein